MRRPARQRRYGKAAGVAKTVEHPRELQALGIVGKLFAAVALIQIKPGFVAGGDVDAQLPTVLLQHQVDRALPAQPAGDLGQTL